MNDDSDRPMTSDRRALEESRVAVQALQFFANAFGAQLAELNSTLGSVQVATTSAEFEERLAQVEAQRDAAQQQAAQLMAQLTEVEQEVRKLQQELERQSVTFADHHAAKQEAARLRVELEALQQQQPSVMAAQSRDERRGWWLFGRS